MLRSAHVAVIDYLISTVRTTVAQMPRGYVDMDTASLSAVTTTLLVGTALGIPLKRKSALANDKYEYDNEAGTNIATNV